MSLEIEMLNGATNGNGYQVDGYNGDSNGSMKPNEDLNNYDTVFPSLPSNGANLTINDVWNNNDNNKLSVKRHQTTTQVFHVPVEERKYKDVAGNSFGNETNKKCNEIATRMGVKVEICCSKDQSLHIVISGNEEKVLDAKKAIIAELQTERDFKMKVPKDQHKFLIGKGGIVLKDLQEKTCTKIQVPKPESNLEYITITGPKDGIDQAVHDIQIIIDEQSKTGMERLNIPKIYHPWIRGINNELANDIAARTGAKINIPPSHSDKDEIVVSGDREKVDLACQEIKRIYKEKSKLNVTKLAIQITKSQHKLIIGKNGSTVQDIFRDYDVYVQVPKSDSPSETIFLFGEESKLGAALSQVCAKANSIVNIKIDVPSWLHRHMIGEKGANISKITADFPNTHVKFEPDNKITLDGPPDEVEKVKERLQTITAGLKQIMICEEISVESRFFPQLIGKKNDHLSKLNKEYGVVVRLPNENSTNGLVRIEGPPDSVQKAKAEFVELLKKLENERSKDIIIEQKYHSSLIGKSGKNLNEIRAKFNDIQINIPNQDEKSEVITIRGNKNDVEKCYKHLQQVVKELQESKYQEEVPIFKEFHRIIIGKSGAFIKKIRDDTQTRIDVPAENSDSNMITIIGKQENVMKARKLFEEKIKELVNIKEDSVEIPHNLHTALIGKGGAIIKQIRKDCGGVIINFPAENTTSNKITIKGPLEEIKKAKAELLKLAEEKNDLSYSEDIVVKAEYHKFLVGRKGNNINTLRDKHNVRVIFPSSNGVQPSADADAPNPNDVIILIGKKENVKAVRAELEAAVKNLEEQITDEVHVDQKWHKNFTARRAKLINEISDENCNVKISFPKAPNSDIVTLKGPRDAVEAAKKRITERVFEFENQVTIEVVIPQMHHVAVIGKGGNNSQKISDDFKVELKFPAKSTADANGAIEQNGDFEQQDSSSQASPSKSDIVLISGLKDDCEKAKEALLALVPQSKDVEFPKKFHKELLVNKAEFLINFSNNFKVQVKVPKKDDNVDRLTIIGTPEHLVDAEKALVEKLNDLELSNYCVELTNIKPELIPQLRGRKGAEAARLEKKFQVKIDFSRIGEPDKIIIRGVQKNVLDCESHIKQKIKEDESKISEEIQIDNRVHSRLIGTQGKSLAKIIEKFKVDIKFAGRDSDAVVVKGDNQDRIDEAIDYLKNLEEEYLQDVVDKEAYTHPSRQQGGGEATTNGSSKGFVVRGAPWEQQANQNAPDTSNMEDFPTITSAVTGPGAASKTTWGPSRK